MIMEASAWLTFLLILVRISTFMVSAPLFSGRQIPAIYKVGVSVLLSILTVGLVQEPMGDVSNGTIVLLILKEFLVGIVLGMAASIFFYAVQLAGTLLDFQIGFAMANLFDPTFEMSTQLTGRLKHILAILVLLATDGHHLLIQGILASFDWITIQDTIPAWMDGRLSTILLYCLQQMFMIGFMMAVPILGTMFVVDVALGIIGKTVPQFNIIAVFPPVKLLIHFMMYIVVLPSFFYLLKILFEAMFDSMQSIL